MQKYFSKDLKFCARVRSYGKKFQTAEKLDIIHLFINCLPFKAKVDLENPDFEMWILLDYGMADNNPNQSLKQAFFARKICKTAREPLLDHYALNKRNYIGTTSTKAELAFLMANQVLARPGAVIYDPFVGTGSIIISCAAFGSTVIGSDIDIRVLKGNGRPF
jgi:tRNA (guanine10-N2)-methyltransferase